jgi:hypothetical protein
MTSAWQHHAESCKTESVVGEWWGHRWCDCVVVRRFEQERTELPVVPVGEAGINTRAPHIGCDCRMRHKTSMLQRRMSVNCYHEIDAVG